MLGTGINNLLGLSRYQSSVRVGNEGRNYGSHSVSVSEVVGVSNSVVDSGVSGHQTDGDLSLSFPLSVHNTVGVSGVSVVSEPGGKVGVGNGEVGVIRGNSTVGVGHQRGISLPFSIVVRVSESEVSITLGEKVGVGGDGKVGVIGCDSAVRVGHQLGISVSLAIDEGVRVDMRHHHTSSVHSEGEVHSTS